jgi:hypothetical protein
MLFMALEASPMGQDDAASHGKAQLIAVRYDRLLGRLETEILQLENGQWQEVEEIPGAVRSYQEPGGESRLAVQELIEDSAFPFAPIHPLTLESGRFEQGHEVVRSADFDWIYNFTKASGDGGKPVWIIVTGSDRLEIKEAKTSWISEQDYGRTPVRLRWGRADLEFHPSMPIAYENGKPALYLVDNIPLFGSSIAAAFGRFRRAEIDKEVIDADGLRNLWTKELDGYVPALALIDKGPSKDRGLLAVSVSSGRSRLYLYDP